ncbi:rhomboid family intramembrane serine protease [Candidatus Riflebacteria bacterium]
MLSQIFVFVLQKFSEAVGFNTLYFFSLVPVLVVQKFFVWQFFTANFLHADFMHLFFNLFTLFMFGPPIEDILQRRIFLQYYLFCALGSYFFHFVFNFNSAVPVLGASGADFGLIFAFCYYYPDQWIYLFFILPMKAWHAGVLFGLLELSSTLQRVNDGIAHLVHIGGLICGILYFKANLFGFFEMLQNKVKKAIRDRKKAKFRVIRFEEGDEDEDEDEEEKPPSLH